MPLRTPQIRCQGRSNCGTCELRQEMVCAEVSLGDLVDFHAGIDDLNFETNAPVFSGGTGVDAVYCIRSGAVKMVRTDLAGAHRIVRVLRKGDIAGLESAFSEFYEHSAVAVSAVKACRIPIADFRRFVTTHQSLQMRLMQKSRDALRETEEWLADLVSGTIPARTRVARLLLRLRIEGTENIHRIGIEDMAAIVGITPETVSRVVSDFVSRGFLEKIGGNSAYRNFRGDIASLTQVACTA